jgi:hypothetical protein
MAVACLAGSTAAFAEEWHYCVATAGVPEGPNKHVHWAVTQAFEVSSIPDWREQFEQAKAERYAFAQSRGWESDADSFICTDGMPSFAAAQELRNGTSANFAERRDVGVGMGLPFSWEDWAWQPTGSAPSNAQAEVGADASEQLASDAQDDDGSAAAERQRQAEAAAAAAKAERDRPAAEKAKQEREAKASTDTDANRCVTAPSLRQNDTFQGNTAAYVSNGCGTPVDVRICLMTESKGWNCGRRAGAGPASTPPARCSWMRA